MLQVQDVYFSIGELELLKGIQWIINPGKRIALIGPNGAGKTTLLRVLAGENPHYTGDICKPKQYTIGYLPQEEMSIGSGPILDCVLQGHQEIIDIEKKMNDLHSQIDSTNGEQADLLKRLGALEERYDALDGYRMESNAKSILSGLGFPESDFQRQLSDFSGGWRMRVFLARILVQKPDLLLMDEPTNHLDLPSLEWLEQYLLNFQGSVVLVSHDRFFIDRLAQEIAELENGKLYFYPGQYQLYLQKKEERNLLLLKRWEEQNAERERQQKFIERFRYKATKAKQVQSRVKQLEKIEQIDMPSASKKKINFQIKVDVPSYKDVLKIKNMAFRYEKEWVLEDIDLDIYRGQKIALVGINGAGKTTLTRLIVGQLRAQAGRLDVGQRTTIGYYAQHQVDALDLDSTVYDEVASTAAHAQLPKVRDILGVFQFSGDDVFKKIRVLSGGEKARVSLAKMLISPVNFLIMDEPTNHLDISSKDALEHALLEYDGTLLLISHDRYFLDKLVSRVLEIKDKHLREYEGNYTEYLKKREEQTIVSTVSESPEKENNNSSKKSKDQKRLEANARQAVSKERNKLKSEIELLEEQISKYESAKSELEEMMVKPETYQDGERAASMQKDYADISQNLQSCYERWEEAQLEYDDIINQLSM